MTAKQAGDAILSGRSKVIFRLTISVPCAAKPMLLSQKFVSASRSPRTDGLSRAQHRGDFNEICGNDGCVFSSASAVRWSCPEYRKHTNRGSDRRWDCWVDLAKESSPL